MYLPCLDKGIDVYRSGSGGGFIAESELLGPVVVIGDFLGH